MRTVLLTLGLLWIAGSAIAQQRTLHRVDQAVEDLDRLATSLRHLDRDLHQNGARANLYRIESDSANAGPRYYRVSPGLRAWLDRSDYLVASGHDRLALNMAPRFDGEFVELVPPNTVFDLRPIVPQVALTDVPLSHVVLELPPPSNLIDARIDTMIGNAVLDHPLEGQQNGRSLIGPSGRPAVSSYHMSRRAIQRAFAERNWPISQLRLNGTDRRRGTALPGRSAPSKKQSTDNPKAQPASAVSCPRSPDQ